MVVRGRWRRADAAGEERRYLPVGVGASAADSVSFAVTVIDHLSRMLWIGCGFAVDLYIWAPWKARTAYDERFRL